MSRLLKDDREIICRKLLERRFYEEIKKLHHEAADLMWRIVQSRFTEEEHALAASLPKGWLYEDNTFYINVLGERHYDYTNGCYLVSNLVSLIRLKADDLPKVQILRFTQQHRDRQCVSLVKGNPLAQEFKAFEIKCRQLQSKIEQAKSEINVLLNSCTTVKKLITTWPEVEPFIPEYLLQQDPKAPKANLPATYIAQLNTVLALP